MQLTCPRVTCDHPADKHKTRPGGLTSYCITCAIEREKGWRTQGQICTVSPHAIEHLHELVDDAVDALDANDIYDQRDAFNHATINA